MVETKSFQHSAQKWEKIASFTVMQMMIDVLYGTMKTIFQNVSSESMLISWGCNVLSYDSARISFRASKSAGCLVQGTVRICTKTNHQQVRYVVALWRPESVSTSLYVQTDQREDRTNKDRKRKVEGIRYEARSRWRSSPYSLAFWACETPRR